MKRIGILGGTFNPVHTGHLILGETVREKFRLDKVIFVPSCNPPHKKNKSLVLPKHRYQMVCLAIRENPCFDVSDFEISKKGISYTVDTLNHFTIRFLRALNSFL